MKKLILVLVALAATLVTPIPTASAVSDNDCNTGSYNYRQAISGGCAWGNIRVVDGTLQYNFVGHDKASDGACANVYIKERLKNANDYDRKFSTCGFGDYQAFQGSVKYREGSIVPGIGYVGSTQYWSVRLCVDGSCTAYKDYQPF